MSEDNLKNLKTFPPIIFLPLQSNAEVRETCAKKKFRAKKIIITFPLYPCLLSIGTWNKKKKYLVWRT
jgi:hypothetical protein